MNKIKGKALSLVLSLALVISSFSAVPASAATKTIAGKLGDVDNDKFYLVNGGKVDTASNVNELVLKGFGTLIENQPTMETKDRHQTVEGVKIAAISRKSGDNLVKWYDSADKNDGIDDETDPAHINLELRNASVSGTEELNVLYKGTYTDENDKEYTVRDTKVVTIRVYDKGQVVLGEQKNNGEKNVKGELDSDFAQKTVSHETALNADGTRNNADTSTDSKTLTALKATTDAAPYVSWEALSTSSTEDAGDNYYLKSTSSSNIELNGADNAAVAKNVKAGISTPGIAFDAAKKEFKVNALLSDGTVTYVYTVDGTAPALKNSTTSAAALAQTDLGAATKLATSNTITDLKGTEKLVIVGYVDQPVTADGVTTHNWVPATETVKKDLTAADVAAKSATDKPLVASAIASPELTVSKEYKAETSAGAADGQTAEITIGAVASVKYYAQADGSDAWKQVTVDSSATAIAARYLPGKSYTVKAVASTADTEATPPEKLFFETKGADTKNVSDTASATYTAATASTAGYVTARVKDKANPASFTFTLQATDTFKTAQKDANLSADDKVSSLDDVKQKAKITKTVLVNDASFTKINKYKTTTYVSSTTVGKETGNGEKVGVNGYEVKFANGGVGVTVSDKANVSKISGDLTKISIDGSSNISEISTDKLNDISIADAKVDKIEAEKAKIAIDSAKANVGEIKKSVSVDITSGKLGNVVASDFVSITPDDDENSVTVGDIETKTISIDSNESKGVKVGTLKATDNDSEIKLTGDNDITIDGIDFDYYGAELKLDGFKGIVPAPKNADATVEGATISTQQADDKVAIKGDTDINSLSIAEESTVSFDGKLNVGSIDGSGKLVVGLGKMNVVSDASDVKLQISDAYKVGDIAYTSAHDTIDVDDIDNYGFTVTKSEASSKDTFKVASTKFVGLALGTATTEIAEGYTQSFKATPYAPGTVIPEGYHVAYTFDGDDTVFSFTDNKDGTATIKTIKTDDSFTSLNKGTLKAELVDADNATNDDYDAAELDVTATKVPPVAYISDTAKKDMKVTDTYRFRITSVGGTQPKSFVVASNGASVTYRGNSGKDYFYDVKAAQVGSYGVYVDGTKVAVLNITNAYTIDTKAVSVNAGKSYQFKVTGPTAPTFTVAGIGNIKAASTSGKDYFFKVTVPANLAKGGHGVYVNGVVMSVLTVK